MKIILSKDDYKIACDVAYYYRCPERTLENEKIRLNEAKARNPDIHYKALEINQTIWNKHKGLR